MNERKLLEETFERLAFFRIFKSFSMAISHNKLLIAFMAVALLGLVGVVMDLSTTVVSQPVANSGGIVITELDKYAENPRAVKNFISEYKDKSPGKGVFSASSDFISERFNSAVIALFNGQVSLVFKNIADIGRSFVWVFMYHPFYSIIYFAILLAVMSIAGGAICRIAALEIARGEKLGAFEALRFAKERFFNLFCAPLIPVCMVGALGIAVLVLGLWGNIPWVGEITIGLLLFFGFILGTLMTLIIIGALGGGCMVYPIIAYESTDGFDVMSRTFSYVYTKPGYLIFYHFAALVYGGLCYIFVRFFAFVILSATYFFLWLSLWTKASNEENVSKLDVIWPGPEFLNLAGQNMNYAMSWSESITAFLVKISVYLVIALLTSFVISFIFSVNTVIYALMRSHVDNVSIDDIYSDQPVCDTPASDEN